MFQARGKDDSSTFQFLVRLVTKSWVKHPDYELSRFLISCFPTDMKFMEKTSGTNSEGDLDTKMQIKKANNSNHMFELNLKLPIIVSLLTGKS